MTVERLKELIAETKSLPWNGDALYSGIRHLDRNCEWYGDHWDEDREVDVRVNVPYREDAALIVAAVNALPSLLAVYDAAAEMRAAGVARCPHCDDDAETATCECDVLAKWREEAFSALAAAVAAVEPSGE